MEVAGEASTGSQVITMVRNEDWDLVLLDISMPELNALDDAARGKVCGMKVSSSDRAVTGFLQILQHGVSGERPELDVENYGKAKQNARDDHGCDLRTSWRGRRTRRWRMRRTLNGRTVGGGGR